MKQLVYIDDVDDVLRGINNEHERGEIAELIVLQVNADSSVDIQRTAGIDLIYALGLLEAAKIAFVADAEEE